jgi:hypothetical protein
MSKQIYSENFILKAMALMNNPNRAHVHYILDKLEEAKADAVREPESGVCKWCTKRIMRYSAGAWTHVNTRDQFVTTAIEAEALVRRWVGYEINPTYYALIAKRTAQRGLFSA